MINHSIYLIVTANPSDDLPDVKEGYHRLQVLSCLQDAKKELEIFREQSPNRHYAILVGDALFVSKSDAGIFKPE